LVVVVVGVVVLVDEVVDGVLGVVELHPTDNAPSSTAAAIPMSAVLRREFCFTNVSPTHARCENGCSADVETPWDSCQDPARAGINSAAVRR
jgi:hypothetical protein